MGSNNVLMVVSLPLKKKSIYFQKEVKENPQSGENLEDEQKKSSISVPRAGK